MTSIVFVHGTGVRSGYDADLALVREQLLKRRSELSVLPCHWADAALKLRADLGRSGASIPQGRFARGEEEEADATVVLWGQLYGDPLYELRLLALLAPEEDTAVEPGVYSAKLEGLKGELVTCTPSPALRDLLGRAGLEPGFDEACRSVAAADVLEQLSADGRHEPELVSTAVARAVVAEAIQLAQRAGSDPPRGAIDADLRDSLVTSLSLELSGASADRGVVEWMQRGVTALLSQGATWYLRRDSAMATHFAFPFSGDILRYQRDGTRIRSFIRAAIAAAPPPVYVLAHSLGGVICFDLLCLEDLGGHVAGLITVGSQAPLLYELDVLAGLSFGTPLPGHFPRWLNFFDQRDMLSFVGSEIFPGRIKDVAVDNRQPFPNAHTSYWSSALLWDTIGRWVASRDQ